MKYLTYLLGAFIILTIASLAGLDLFEHTYILDCMLVIFLGCSLLLLSIILVNQYLQKSETSQYLDIIGQKGRTTDH